MVLAFDSGTDYRPYAIAIPPSTHNAGLSTRLGKPLVLVTLCFSPGFGQPPPKPWD